MQRNLACTNELGQNELGGRIGAIGSSSLRLPIRKGEKLAGLDLGCRSFRPGKPMSNLYKHTGEARCGHAVCIGTCTVMVVDLPQQPANCADWSTKKALGGEITSDSRGPNSEIDRVPVRQWSPERVLGILQYLLGA